MDLSGTINVLNKKTGEIVNCEVKQKKLLRKHDRMLDYSTIPILKNLSLSELYILFDMWDLANTRNFIADKAIETNITDRTKYSSIKKLIALNLIKKAIWQKTTKIGIKGYMLNPIHYRKSRNIDLYFELLEIYNGFYNKDEILITMKEENQVYEELKEIN